MRHGLGDGHRSVLGGIRDRVATGVDAEQCGDVDPAVRFDGLRDGRIDLDASGEYLDTVAARLEDIEEQPLGAGVLGRSELDG